MSDRNSSASAGTGRAEAAHCQVPTHTTTGCRRANAGDRRWELLRRRLGDGGTGRNRCTSLWAGVTHSNAGRREGACSYVASPRKPGRPGSAVAAAGSTASAPSSPAAFHPAGLPPTALPGPHLCSQWFPCSSWLGTGDLRARQAQGKRRAAVVPEPAGPEVQHRGHRVLTQMAELLGAEPAAARSVAPLFLLNGICVVQIFPFDS